MKNIKRSLSVIMILLMILALLPGQAFAAGKIVTDQDVALTISYMDGDTPIENAKFSLYKVADVDEYFRVSLTSDFEPYKNTVAGLNDLVSVDQAGWLNIASTLKGYVLRDGLAVSATGRTDGAGTLQLKLKPGLYLVLGTRITLEESFYTYTATPYMLFLPGLDTENNEWVYSVTSVPKFSKEYNPQDDPDDISRKVIKVWDDSGYESIRPEEVTVQLLRDGAVFDTKVLNKSNNWRYKWDELETGYEWLIVEKEMEHYAATITQNGITFTVSNKYVVPIIGSDPPVQKRVTGDRPSTAATFTFVLKALDPSNPMPIGSTGSQKTMSIRGAGSVEFGDITFDKPGVYEYTISEQNTGEDGYTYDTNVYRVKYVVEQKDGTLTCVRTITDSSGAESKVVEFTNNYKTPSPKLPQTGMLWWPVPVLLLAGFAFVMVGVLRRRRSNG